MSVAGLALAVLIAAVTVHGLPARPSVQPSTLRSTVMRPSKGQATSRVDLVAGVRNFTHIVESLERSVGFYRDVIGLQPDGEPRTFAGEAAMSVVNAPGSARALFTTMSVPQSPLGVEIVEYQGLDRKAVRPRFQDPGSATLSLTVRDIDAIVGRATKAGTRIVTPGGAPLSVRVGARIILMQDPDGFFIGLVQPPTIPEGAPPGNIIGSSFDIRVADTDRTAQLYREALGFDLQSSPWTAGDVMTPIAGTPGGQMRQSVARIPGTLMTMAFFEFREMERSPLRTRFQDPGTAVLQVLVRDVAAVTAAWKKAGGEVITAGGEPVSLGNLTLVVLRDPNNLMLELISTP